MPTEDGLRRSGRLVGAHKRASESESESESASESASESESAEPSKRRRGGGAKDGAATTLEVAELRAKLAEAQSRVRELEGATALSWDDDDEHLIHDEGLAFGPGSPPTLRPGSMAATDPAVAQAAAQHMHACDGHRSNQVPLTPGRALRQPHAHRGAAPEGQSSRKRKNPDALDAELVASLRARVSDLEKEREELDKTGIIGGIEIDEVGNNFAKLRWRGMHEKGIIYEIWWQWAGDEERWHCFGRDWREPKYEPTLQPDKPPIRCRVRAIGAAEWVVSEVITPLP